MNPSLCLTAGYWQAICYIFFKILVIRWMKVLSEKRMDLLLMIAPLYCDFCQSIVVEVATKFLSEPAITIKWREWKWITIMQIKSGAD